MRARKSSLTFGRPWKAVQITMDRELVTYRDRFVAHAVQVDSSVVLELERYMTQHTANAVAAKVAVHSEPVVKVHTPLGTVTITRTENAAQSNT